MSQDCLNLFHEFLYDESKQAFQQELDYVLRMRSLVNRTVKSKEHIDEIITEIKGNINYCRNLLLKAKVVNINSEDRLCRIGRGQTYNPSNIDIKLVLSIDEIFDILAEIHMSKPRLLESQKDFDKVSNIDVDSSLIKLFLKACRICNTSKRHIWTTLEKHNCSVGEMGLISVVPEDQDFKQIFMYIDINTNYVLLRPLKNKSYTEVALELLNIFCDFGTPVYLNCLQKKFFYKVLEVLKTLELPIILPTIKIQTDVHKLGTMTQQARHHLKDWMKNSDCKNWVIGAHIVQWILNSNKVVDTYVKSTLVNGIIHSPYHALFGKLPHKELVHLNASIDKNKDMSAKHEMITNKILLNCSHCKQLIYKVYLCHYCRAPCHITCCKRLYLNKLGVCVIVNKCKLCAAKD